MFGNNTQISSSNFNILDVGGADGTRARQSFPDCRIITIDKKYGWNIEVKGLMQGNWDVIFANHIIEHLINPDQFLEECKRVMHEHTILEIGTPNLTAWFNRILFLFGYVPHSVELSNRKAVGRAFNWNNEPLGGHIFIYTVPAFIQLLKLHGFKIISIEGEYSTYPCHPLIKIIDRVLTKLNVNMASTFRIRCTL